MDQCFTCGCPTAAHRPPAMICPPGEVRALLGVYPVIFPCGCSRFKVQVGMCSTYDVDGLERETTTRAERLREACDL